MARTYLLGLAGVALLAATGAASAADVAPVIAQVVTPVVAPVTVAGPVFTLKIDKMIGVGRELSTPGAFYFGSYTIEAGARTASGLGVTVTAEGGYDLFPLFPFETDGEAGIRIYKTFGNLEIGASANSHFGFPGGFYAPDFGFDVAYTIGRVKIENTSSFEFCCGTGFDLFVNTTKTTFTLSEMLSVYGALILDTNFAGNGGFDFAFGGEAKLGPLTLHADATRYEPGGWDYALGVDFASQFRSTPLSFIANAELTRYFMGPTFVTAGVGIRYSVGAE